MMLLMLMKTPPVITKATPRPDSARFGPQHELRSEGVEFAVRNFSHNATQVTSGRYYADRFYDREGGLT